MRSGALAGAGGGAAGAGAAAGAGGGVSLLQVLVVNAKISQPTIVSVLATWEPEPTAKRRDLFIGS